MTPTLQQWQTVPDLVAELVPQAFRLRQAYEKIAARTHDLLGSTATWDTPENVLCVYRPGVTAEKTAGAIRLRPFAAQPDWSREILLKTAAIPGISHVFDFGNKMLGGPTPLSNAIVSGLMLGGAGYGAGALAENLFPERYLERGRLRRTLGLTGLGAGALLGVNNAYANSRRTGDGFLKSLVTRHDGPLPAEKAGFDGSGAFFNPGMSDSGLYAPTVSVPQFNQAAWSDVNKGMRTGLPQFTPPAYAAATTGLLAGLSTAQRSPILRPVDVIRGIASAGVGLATANIAGRALSALAGLTPAGQEKLQDMGLWGGMMHAIVPTLFQGR
jgi:hypothetical protein